MAGRYGASVAPIIEKEHLDEEASHLLASHRSVIIDKEKQHYHTYQRISFLTKVIYGAPAMSTWPVIVMFGMFGKIYYEEFGASLSHIALFTAIARAICFITDPAMSYITDTAKCCGSSRRLGFMTFGCCFYGVLLWLLLNPPFANEFWINAWYAIMLVCFNFAATFTLIPYDALGAEMSDDPEERTGLYFVQGFFELLGLLLAVGVPMSMQQVSSFLTTPNDYICKSGASTANHCFKGQSCDPYFSQGKPGAFIFNSTLAFIMGNVSSLQTVPDAAYRCANDKPLLISIFDNTTSLLTPGQRDAFCHCFAVCEAACLDATKRSGFSTVGWCGGVWFIAMMILCIIHVCYDGERKDQSKGEPWLFVPSMRQAFFNNKCFRPVMRGWICDAVSLGFLIAIVPHFVKAVLQPEFMTMVDDDYDCSPSNNGVTQFLGLQGSRTSGEFDWRCESTNITVLAYAIIVFTAILSMPAWKILAQHRHVDHGKCIYRWGKAGSWQASSGWAAIGLLLLCFVRKGYLLFSVFVACVNGIALGAMWMAPSILSDIVDYDEYLTETRREAMYFQFKSFIPKVIMVPIVAIPLAFMDLLGGYKPDLGGLPVEQPASVEWFLKVVIVLVACLSLLAFKLKKDYPFFEDKDVRAVTTGILIHSIKEKLFSEDPIDHGKYYKPPRGVHKGENQELYQSMLHFDNGYLYKTLCKKGQKDEVPSEKLMKKAFKDLMPLGIKQESEEKAKLLKKWKRTLKKGCEDVIADHLCSFFKSVICVIIHAAVIGVVTYEEVLPKLGIKEDFLSGSGQHGQALQLIPLLLIISFGATVFYSFYRYLQYIASLKLEEIINPKSKRDKEEGEHEKDVEPLTVMKILDHERTVASGEVEKDEVISAIKAEKKPEKPHQGWHAIPHTLEVMGFVDSNEAQ